MDKFILSHKNNLFFFKKPARTRVEGGREELLSRAFFFLVVCVLVVGRSRVSRACDFHRRQMQLAPHLH
jgi:hypothetical protein